jgi:hypothetical protein
MRVKNILTVFCASIALVLLFTEADAQRQKTKKRLNTVTTDVKMSNDERRKEIENLMLRGKYQHDGSGELFYIGTSESVPALLKVLEVNPPKIEKIEDEENIPQVKKPGEIQKLSEAPKVKREPRKFYICTYIHAVNALQKITGQKFTDYQDWKIWWERYQKTK